MADPTAALFRVDIDANEGLGVRAMNLAQAVVEYEAMTFTTPIAHLIFCGLLFSPQQSVEFAVPTSDLYPAGHCVHDSAPLALENVSGAQDEQDVAATESWYCPGAHNEHATGPGTFLYFPSSQVTHGPVRSGPV